MWRDEINSVASIVLCSWIKQKMRYYQSYVYSINMFMYVKEYSGS